MWEKGHFRRKCLSKKIQQKDDGNKKSLVEDENAYVDSVSIKENSWVMQVVAGVTKHILGSQLWKVPYMIHNNGTGIECQSSRTKC